VEDSELKRFILSKSPGYAVNSISVYIKKDELFEAVKIDRGSLSEIVGCVIVLLAIDQAAPVDQPSTG
jgi:hypothetical protein